MKYVARFISTTKGEEGTYYLVNGWNTYKTFFTHSMSPITYFKRLQDVKMSISKLMKIDKENGFGYANDQIEIIQIGG